MVLPELGQEGDNQKNIYDYKSCVPFNYFLIVLLLPSLRPWLFVEQNVRRQYPAGGVTDQTEISPSNLLPDCVWLIRLWQRWPAISGRRRN